MKPLKIFILFIFIFNSHVWAYTPTVIAHRGVSSVAPENTLAAFSKAVEFLADYFELDVQVSKDDSLMVMHDANVDSTTNGSGLVSELTYSQLRELDAGSWFGAEFYEEKIPTLREALLLAKNNNIKVCIEIKAETSTVAQAVVNLVEQLQMENQVIIFCFDFNQIEKSKILNPSIPVLYLIRNLSNDEMDRAYNIGAEYVAAGKTTDQVYIDYAHEKGMNFWRWTVNDYDEMLNCIQKGVNGIITNYPQTLIPIVDDTAPTDVILTTPTVDETRITLNWLPAEDLESGIHSYIIYRDTTATPTVPYKTVDDTTSFLDVTWKEQTTFYYRVKAQNNKGINSINFSNEIAVTTDIDVTAPQVVNVSAVGNPHKILIFFNERLDTFSAEDINNYEIDNQVDVLSAYLSLDFQTVILTTSELLTTQSYTLSIKNVTDRAKSPNIMSDYNGSFLYQSYSPSLKSVWRMDEAEGDTIYDYSVNANNGWLMNNPARVVGKFGNALQFDGVDDYVQLPASSSLDINNNEVTLSLWIKFDELPDRYAPVFDSNQNAYSMFYDFDNSELTFKVTTTTTSKSPAIPGDKIKLDEWLHIVGVYDGRRAMIYLNGVLLEKLWGISGDVVNGQVARLGEKDGYCLKGAIDDIRVYNRALEQEEIASLYSGEHIETSVEQRDLSVPYNFDELNNYPNPFNSSTVLRFDLVKPSHIIIDVYNTLGSKIITLCDSNLSDGIHQINWDGRDQLGLSMPTGVYFFRVSVNSYVKVSKVMLLR